jgi:hypothetical protein
VMYAATAQIAESAASAQRPVLPSETADV